MLSNGGREPSLRALADRVGVSPMALYRYFPSKAALMAAVADAGFRSLHERLEAADRSSVSVDEALVAQGMAYISFALSEPSLFRLMFSDGLAETSGYAWRDETYALLARRVAVLAQGDRQDATLACWAVVHGLAMLQLSSSLSTERGEIRQALEVIVQALQPNI